MSTALLTRMSMSEASFTSRAMSSGLRRSVTWVAASIWCCERSRSASAFNWSPLRAASRRWQPSSAKASAAAAPMPLEAPVIRTRLPRRCRSMDFLSCWTVRRRDGGNGIEGMQPRSTLHCSVAPRRSLVHCRGFQHRQRGRPGKSQGSFSMSSKKQYRIAVIPGDGIGKEVMPEGLRVIEAAAKKHGVSVKFDHFDFASYDYYEKHGEMMPADWKEKIGKHDAIYFGAVGWPAKIPDHISLWGSLIKFRRELDQYVNLRPVRLMPGVPSPLAGRKPGH